MKRLSWILVCLISLIGISASAQEDEMRTFAMGFTPFPYEISFPAVSWTYDAIEHDADLIAHHFDNGVPWDEALNGEPFSRNIQGDWELRRSRTLDDQIVYLSITPIAFLRDGLAPYRGEQDDMPLPEPWSGYTFNHPDVVTAFINYARRAIDWFQPDYLNVGVEVNLLKKINPAMWGDYVLLHGEVYETLKADYPDLTIFVSLTGIDMLEGYTDANHAEQMNALVDIMPYTDLIAWSLYPYMTSYMTNAIPMDMFDRLAELVAPFGKTTAVAETGYPAQSFAIQATDDLRLEFEGTPELQADYIDMLLSKAQEYRMAFVINFILRDYDALWQQIGGQEDLTIAWRDTGLYAEDGTDRPALVVWRRWLERPYHPDW